MSRQRDYQPTIDRARNQAEIAQRREAKLRERKDECHREMLRAQAAARIASEEADALRDRKRSLEQGILDFRSEIYHLKNYCSALDRALTQAQADLDAAKHPWRTAWRGMRERVREMMTRAEEA
jgi:predicted  nucleic acid-binding Zn-ribbon protein